YRLVGPAVVLRVRLRVALQVRGVKPGRPRARRAGEGRRPQPRRRVLRARGAVAVRRADLHRLEHPHLRRRHRPAPSRAVPSGHTRAGRSRAAATPGKPYHSRFRSVCSTEREAWAYVFVPTALAWPGRRRAGRLAAPYWAARHLGDLPPC